MKKRSVRIAPQSVLRVLAMPTLLAVTSLAGLVLGLTGHGWRDLLSAGLLLLPAILAVWFWQHRT